MAMAISPYSEPPTSSPAPDTTCSSPTASTTNTVKGKKRAVSEAKTDGLSDEPSDAVTKITTSSKTTAAKRAKSTKSTKSRFSVASSAKQPTPFNPILKDRRKAPTVKPATAKEIPRAYTECDAADKALFDGRNAGKPWPELRQEYLALSVGKVEHLATSTLPNRYKRLKTNFEVIAEEDNARILEAKIEVETNFEKMKWGMIGDLVKERGGKRYFVGYSAMLAWHLGILLLTDL